MLEAKGWVRGFGMSLPWEWLTHELDLGLTSFARENRSHLENEKGLERAFSSAAVSHQQEYDQESPPPPAMGSWTLGSRRAKGLGASNYKGLGRRGQLLSKPG